MAFFTVLLLRPFFRYQTCYAYMKYLRLNGVLGWVMGFTDLSPTLLIFHTMGYNILIIVLVQRSVI